MKTVIIKYIPKGKPALSSINNVLNIKGDSYYAVCNNSRRSFFLVSEVANFIFTRIIYVCLGYTSKLISTADVRCGVK